MFNVFRDGTFIATHKTLADACRFARQQAKTSTNAYFTVFEVDTEVNHCFEAGSDTLWGLPEYIILPKQEEEENSIIKNAIPLSEASSLLRVRLPNTLIPMAEHPLV